MAAPFGSFPYDAAGIDLFAHPLFINAMRAPSTQDIYNPGTQWMDGSVSPKVIYQTTGGGNWPAIGGAGVFTTLTVSGLSTLGALTQVGTASINASGAAVTTIGTGGTGAVNIGNATGGIAATGNMTWSTATQGPVQTPVTALGASPQTVNGRVFAVTFTGVSIAGGATQSFTIANSTITGASTVIQFTQVGATSGAALTIQSVTNSASQSVVVVTNGTGATTTTANITFIGHVLT